MKLHHVCGLAAVLFATAGHAQAPFQKAEDAVKYRQSALSVMGTHFSRLGAMANGRVPFDAAVAQDNAALVRTLSRLPWAGFTPDTQGLTTKAKPEVWRETERFQGAAEKMQAAVAELDAAARTGDLNAIRKTFGDAAASCKACHDHFRR